MTVNERIQILLLLEQMNKNKKAAKKAGLIDVSKFKNNIKANEKNYSNK